MQSSSRISTRSIAGGELLYAALPSLPPLEAVRGTIVFLDWRWLREHGIYERYLGQLPLEQKDALLSAATSDWVPVEQILGHYRAMDAVGLSRAQALDVGRTVGEGAHGALLRTLVSLAGQAGTNPWFALSQAQKLWDRSWRGGGVLVYRLGDRAARVEVLKTPVARSRFHRASFAGAIAAGIAGLCRRCGVDDLDALATSQSFGFRLEWV